MVRCTDQTESFSSEMARWSSNEWNDIFIGHPSAVRELTWLFHGCLAERADEGRGSVHERRNKRAL